MTSLAQALIYQCGKAAGEELDLTKFTHKDEKLAREFMEGLTNALLKTSAERMFVHANHDSGWLTGPSGHVTLFPSSHPFTCDLFKADFFQVTMLAEITSEEEIWDDPKHQIEMRQAVRKTIPLKSLRPPQLTDDETSGWAPALGTNGAFIGIVSYQNTNSNRVNAVRRHFICVHTGLHEQTVEMIQDHDNEVARKNRDLLMPFDASRSGSDDRSQPTVVTYGQAFDDTSMRVRMLRVAKENARRLIYMFADTAALRLKVDPIKRTQTTYLIPSDKFPTKAPYPPELAKEALRWWPTETTIYPFTMIQSYPGDTAPSPEAEESKPPEKLQGFLLGEYCAYLKRHNEKEFLELCKVYKIFYEDCPMAAIPLCYCDSNTFRKRELSIAWYSNCAPVDDDGDPLYAVLRVLNLQQGIQCYNAKFITTDEDARHHHYWRNDLGDGFPVVFPFEIPKIPIAPQANQAFMETMFFSLYHGGAGQYKKVFPRQLQGSFRNIDEMNSEANQRHLFAENRAIQTESIVFAPKLIYLSPGVQDKPKFMFLA